MSHFKEIKSPVDIVRRSIDEYGFAITEIFNILRNKGLLSDEDYDAILEEKNKKFPDDKYRYDVSGY